VVPLPLLLLLVLPLLLKPEAAAAVAGSSKALAVAAAAVAAEIKEEEGRLLSLLTAVRGCKGARVGGMEFELDSEPCTAFH